MGEWRYPLFGLGYFALFFCFLLPVLGYWVSINQHSLYNLYVAVLSRHDGLIV